MIPDPQDSRGGVNASERPGASETPAPVSSIQPDPKRPPFSCGGCSNRWSGLNVCHCSRCHRTFSGAGLFDRHRTGGHCDPGVDLGTVRGNNGGLVFVWRGDMWRGPELPEEILAKLRAAKGAAGIEAGS